MAVTLCNFFFTVPEGEVYYSKTAPSGAAVCQKIGVRLHKKEKEKKVKKR